MTEPLFPQWDTPDLYGDRDELDAAALDGSQALTLADAARHNRRAGEILDRARTVREQYDAEIRRLEAERYRWLDSLRPVLEGHNRIVEMWHRKARRAGEPGIEQTHEFPSGPKSKLIAKSEPSLVVEDEEAFRTWAAEAERTDEFYPLERRKSARRTDLRERLSWQNAEGAEPNTVLKAADPTTGQVVPGVHLLVEDDNFVSKHRTV